VLSIIHAFITTIRMVIGEKCTKIAIAYKKFPRPSLLRTDAWRYLRRIRLFEKDNCIPIFSNIERTATSINFVSRFGISFRLEKHFSTVNFDCKHLLSLQLLSIESSRLSLNELLLLPLEIYLFSFT